MTENVVTLVPRAQTDKDSLQRILDGLQKDLNDGKLTSLAVVQYNGHEPFTWLSSSLTFAQVAWASKLIDGRLNKMMAENEPS
jgi:hypothetical protein